MEIDLNGNQSGENEEDILKFLGDDSPDDENLEEPKEEEKTEETSEEEEESEEEPKIEEEDDTRNWDIPSIDALTKKYPEIAKEFPGLKKALDRESEFTEVFDSPEEAKDAAEVVENFKQFETSLMSGNIESVLNAVKESDPNSFAKITDGILQTLQKVDEKAYVKTVSNVIKATSASMFQAGGRLTDETQKKNLQLAARYLNNFAFGTSEILRPDVQASESKEDPKAKELEEKEKAFQDRQFNNAKDALDTKIHRVIENSIDRYLDPKQQMSEYVRGKAKNEIVEKLDETISADTRFKKNLDALWKDAFEDDFSAKSTEKIRKAYLAKAETVLPQVLKEVRSNALRGNSKRTAKKPENNEGRSLPQRRTDAGQKTQEKPRGTSKDISSFLMQD